MSNVKQFIKDRFEITSDAEMALIGYDQWISAVEAYAMSQFKPAPPVSREVKPLSECTNEHMIMAYNVQDSISNVPDERKVIEVTAWIALDCIPQKSADYLRQFYDIPNQFPSTYPINGDVDIDWDKLSHDLNMLTEGNGAYVLSGYQVNRVISHLRDAALSLPNGEKWVSKSFEQLIEEHGKWADVTFPKGTALGALLHAQREVSEIYEDVLNDASDEQTATEYADALFCIMDSARRRGISVAKILSAGDAKLTKNKGRTWKDNGDGSYSHVKSN